MRFTLRTALIASHLAVFGVILVALFLVDHSLARDATLAGTHRPLLFVSAVGLPVAIALGRMAARAATQPLRTATTTVTRLARGHYDLPEVAPTGDEIGTLSRSLVYLSLQLKRRIGELVEEGDYLSAILTGMAEGVLVINGEGRVIVANPAAKKILGAETSLVGMPLTEAVSNVELRTFIEESALRTGSESRETEIETSAGGGMFIAVYVTPLTASSDRGIVAVLHDMTAVRKLMTMRRDFVANVSHEIRTPVTAIQGYAETLLRGTTDPATTKEFLEIVHRQAHRIGALVTELLALSELEARPREAVIRERVELEAIVRHVAQTVRGRAEARGATVEVQVGDLAVMADPAGLERVIENLVDNAIKYGKSHGGLVRVTASRNADRVALAVADDGPGIEKQHTARVFERFYRVDPGRSRAHGGAGLGLAIVKHLVESMGGTIEIESDVGKGTRFTVDLPAQ